MAKYQIWDKKSNIYTHSGAMYTPEQWIAKYPWVAINGAKMIISTGIINGGCAMEFEATKEIFKNQGASITDEMNDTEVLQAIENFEKAASSSDTTPTAEERIAAALEYQVMASLPDDSSSTGTTTTNA